MKRYEPEAKAAIIEAAVTARRAGKSWAEAFQAAQAAGYGGSQPGLEQFVRYVSKKQRRRGRPPGSRNRPKGTAGADIQSIEAMIGKIVQERVGAAIDGAIGELERLRNP
jgi:hypothetical protein